MLELLPRIPFGNPSRPDEQSPWPGIPPLQFDLAWLQRDFAPAQQARLKQITDAIAAANQKIEQVRARATNGFELGQPTKNGVVLRTGAETRLMQEVQTHAQRQVVDQIIKIKNAVDPVALPVLRDMQRASLTAGTLAERVFSKIACLGRANAGLKFQELATLKASYMAMLAHIAPIELHRIAQACLDDASANSLPLLDCCRMVNFQRSRDDKSFLNATIVSLAQVPEYDTSQPLLQSVIDANNTAVQQWAVFKRDDRGATLKIVQGLGKGQAQTYPIDGDE